MSLPWLTKRVPFLPTWRGNIEILDEKVHLIMEYYARPCQNIVELKSLLPRERIDKQIRYVEDVWGEGKGASYVFDIHSAAAENLPVTVAPTEGSGRWLILGEAAGFLRFDVYQSTLFQDDFESQAHTDDVWEAVGGTFVIVDETGNKVWDVNYLGGESPAVAVASEMVVGEPEAILFHKGIVETKVKAIDEHPGVLIETLNWGEYLYTQGDTVEIPTVPPTVSSDGHLANCQITITENTIVGGATINITLLVKPPGGIWEERGWLFVPAGETGTYDLNIFNGDVVSGSEVSFRIYAVYQPEWGPPGNVILSGSVDLFAGSFVEQNAQIVWKLVVPEEPEPISGLVFGLANGSEGWGIFGSNIGGFEPLFSIPATPGQWYSLKIDNETEGIYKFYIDDVLVYTLQTVIPDGTYALVVLGNGGSAHGRFDDVSIITKIDPTPAPSETLRGRMIMKTEEGVADQVFTCRKKADGTFEFVLII